MSITKTDSVFTVSPDMVPTGQVLPYDLYVNASGREGYERFVCIFKHGKALTENERHELTQRFHHLYVREIERGSSLRTFTAQSSASPVVRTTLVKDTAIKHLGQIFHSGGQEISSQVLNESLTGCKDSVESLLQVIEKNEVDQIQDLIAKLSFHDFYTFDHSINVAMYCIAIYRMIKPNASRAELTIAGLGGLLHDIGKVKIPTNIINSPYKLSDDEYKTIRQHPGWGHELLESPKVDAIGGGVKRIVQQVIYQHHENYDGSGYPNHLIGEDIHILARLTALSDFYDAITTQRSYHEVLDPEEALNLMRNSVGRKIDPKLFTLFSRHMMEHKHCQIDRDYPHHAHLSFDPCQPCLEMPWKEPSPERMLITAA